MAEDAKAIKDEKIVETPETEANEAPVEEEKFAKSGKKSKKHIEEVKAEEERQARKVERAKEEAEAEAKPKGEAPKVRPLIERRGKNYRKAFEKVEKGKDRRRSKSPCAGTEELLLPHVLNQPCTAWSDALLHDHVPAL